MHVFRLWNSRPLSYAFVELTTLKIQFRPQLETSAREYMVDMLRENTTKIISGVK